jgi:hypothetical protein
VAGQARCSANLDLAEHSGEIERALQLNTAAGLAGRVIRLNAESLASPKAVRITREIAGSLRTGILREARVYVQIAKERLAKF